MTDVLLVTCRDLPDGEPAGHLLVGALADRGLSARWVRWDDPDVDWAQARVVACRSTWDYELRREEFLAWARSVGPALLNGPEVFAWNTDKTYLVGLLEAGLPVVPTVAVEAGDESGLAIALARFAPAVVKPAVAAGGRGVVVFDAEPAGPGEPADLDESRLAPGPWVVQPLVESVRTEGETSVFVLGGEVVGQARKLPAAGEIRVHEEYGGATRREPVTEEAAALAREVVRAAEERLGVPLPYARVDAMRLPDGTLALSELEATEPGLYLEVLPELAGEFAAVVARVATSAAG